MKYLLNKIQCAHFFREEQCKKMLKYIKYDKELQIHCKESTLNDPLVLKTEENLTTGSVHGNCNRTGELGGLLRTILFK